MTSERRKRGRTAPPIWCGRRRTIGTAGSVTAAAERLQDRGRGDIMIDFGAGVFAGFTIASMMWAAVFAIADAVCEKINERKDDKK